MTDSFFNFKEFEDEQKKNKLLPDRWFRSAITKVSLQKGKLFPFIQLTFSILGPTEFLNREYKQNLYVNSESSGAISYAKSKISMIGKGLGLLGMTDITRLDSYNGFLHKPMFIKIKITVNKATEEQQNELEKCLTIEEFKKQHTPVHAEVSQATVQRDQQAIENQRQDSQVESKLARWEDSPGAVLYPSYDLQGPSSPPPLDDEIPF